MADGAGVKAPRRRARAEKPPTTPDPVEIAMEAVRDGREPKGAAQAVLTRHARLLDWQIASERMSVVLKVLTGAAGLAVAVAIGALVWGASRYQGLVVQAFSVPPELAARGVTGEAVAGDLLDNLVALQAGTDSIRAASSYAIEWGDEIEVEIPQTGVSIGELQRSLRAWLGRETRISGVVYRTPDGQLAITARTAGSAGRTFVGPEAEIASLLRQAAENVYARTQPYRYSIYLSRRGDSEATLAFYADGANWPSDEQAWRQRGWGLQLRDMGDQAAAAAKFREAVAVDPRMGTGWWAVCAAETSLSHREPAAAACREALRLMPDDRALSDESRLQMTDSTRSVLAFLEGDSGTMLRIIRASSTPIGGSTPNSLAIAIADARILQHDWAGPMRELAALPLVPFTGDTMAHGDNIYQLQQRLAAAVAAGDPTEVLARAAGLEAYIPVLPDPRNDLERIIWPARATALASAGRLAEAQALAARLPRDCFECLIARAQVAEIAGDRAAADRWFAEAERQTPSLPHAPLAWGQAKLARGDVDGAIAKLRDASRKGPRFADPLTYWGEALLAKGDARAALAKLEAAAALAPRWGRNHVLWGEALARLGEADEARAHWRTAAGFSLRADERARLEAVQRRTG